MPPDFSWVDHPVLAALAMPDDPSDFAWLRRNGIDVLVSLTEHPPPRNWVNEAGLMGIHVPVMDMAAPSIRQLDAILETIDRAAKANMGVAVHCAAGKGRTGTVLAVYFLTQGLSAAAAIDKVRDLRPGSVETRDQERAVAEYEARLRATRRGPTE